MFNKIPTQQKMITQYKRYLGMEYFLDKRSIIVQLISMTKENVMFDDIDLKVIITAFSELQNSISSKQRSSKELFGDLNVKEHDVDINTLSFYKFVSKDTLINYLKKGKFQFGSLQYYREIEKENCRDEKEGLSNLLITTGNRQVFASVISGFNQFIFCGTDNIDEWDQMANKFGKVCIKLKNIKSFADKVQASIGAKSWQIKKVTYSDFKAYSVNQEIKNLDPENIGYNQDLINFLIDYSMLPSIFCKPIRFSNEHELRFTFEMDRNVKKKMLLDNLGLLKEFEIVSK